MFLSPAAAAAKSLQLCLTLRPHRRQPPGSPAPGILQARALEWAAISFSSAWKWKWSGSVASDVGPRGLQPTYKWSQGQGDSDKVYVPLCLPSLENVSGYTASGYLFCTFLSNIKTLSNIFCRASLVQMNSLRFYLEIFPSCLKDSLYDIEFSFSRCFFVSP